MTPQVTVPVRLRIDATAAADGTPLPLLRAALARALDKAAATAPVGTVSAPTFQWYGPGLPELPAGTRERVEREIATVIAELCPAPASPGSGGGGGLHGVKRFVDRALLSAVPKAARAVFTVHPATPLVPADAATPAVWLLETMSVRQAAERLYGRPDDWERLVYWYNRDLWTDEHARNQFRGFLPHPDDTSLRPGQRLRVEPGLLVEPLRTQVREATAARTAAELTATGGARLTAEISGPVPMGSTVRIGLKLPADVYPVRVEWELRHDPVYRVRSGEATVSGPKGDLTEPENAPPHIWDLETKAAGAHVVVCRLHLGEKFWQEVYLPLLVLTAKDLAWLMLRSTSQPPVTLKALRAAQQTESTDRRRALTHDPRTGTRPTGPYIAADPAGDATTGGAVRYWLRWPDSLHSDRTTVRWSARALAPAAPGEWRTPEKRALGAMRWGLWEWIDAREQKAPSGLLSEHTHWDVTWDRPGEYEIVCEVSTPGIEPVRHRQKVSVEIGTRPSAAPPPLPRTEAREADARLAYMDETLARGETVPLRAAWVSASDEPAAVALNLYATTVPGAPATGVHLRIWDHSPGGRRRFYEGSGDTAAAALDSALDALGRVPYPRGALLLESDPFALAGQAFPARRKVIETRGETPLAEFLSQFSNFLFVSGALLSLAGAPYVGGPLIVTSQLGGSAAAAVRLHDRYLSGTLKGDGQTATDILELAGGVTGAIGRIAALREITPAGGLTFVADVDGVIGKIQFVTGQADMAARLDAAIRAKDRRQIADILVEAVRAKALEKLGDMADDASGEQDAPAPAHPEGQPADQSAPAAATAPHRSARADFLNALPADLHAAVRVLDNGGRTVAVRYDLDMFGRPAKLEIHAGPDATADDARQHLDTIRMIQSYQGLGGPWRIILDRTRAMLRDEAEPMHFTQAWDARGEIAKLTAIVAEERAKLAHEPNGQARRRIADLELQIQEHRWTLDELDSRQGGLIAAKDRRRAKRLSPQAVLDVRSRIAMRLTELAETSAQIREDTKELEERLRAANKNYADATRRGASRQELDALAAVREELVEARQELSAEQAANQKEQLYWRGAEQRAALDRYPWLRDRTPGDTVQKEVVAAANGVDALGNRPAPDDPLTADHIVCVREIVLMEDFVLLTDEAALEILNLRENLVPLVRSANSSRSDTPWEHWQGWTRYTKDRARRDKLIAQEARLRKVIRDKIRDALHKQLSSF
ncbi:hypothetical protein ACFYWX_39650 [Streptomyces sp. NPDC002888]|uniref:hypothetical protein n=1 Tax=Streptomyces sp. NPDC002888 TaxID=3364668 RepID=UPI0036AD4743